MNEQTLLQQLTRDAEAPTSRREALRRTGRLGAGLALAVLPAAFLVSKRSFAQDGAGPIDILNYALTLEYLEASYYRQGVDSGVITDAAAEEVFTLIRDHEAAHVDFLSGAITAAGGEPVEFQDEDFDFQALGVDPFADYSVFLVLAQAFEDTGVRAYKGQAPNIPRDLVVSDTNVLTAALQIHSLEARHAAEVRRLRALRGETAVAPAEAPWILLDSHSDGTPLEPIYAGEENVTQAKVDITTLGDYSAKEASAAFDEPLSMEAVLAIANPFFNPQA